MKLFVSYARVDVPLCKQIVERLSQAHEVWFDQRLFAGQDWWKEIEHRLGWCEGFIYFLSPESVASPYCQQEFDIASKGGKHIFPVLIQARALIPESLHVFHYADLSQGMENIHILLNALVIAERTLNHAPKVLEYLPEDADDDELDPSQAINPLNAVGSAADAMQAGNYDEAVFILKKAQELTLESRDARIIAMMLRKAEAELERQAYLRQAQREYAPIKLLIDRDATRPLGCEELNDFRKKFPDYDPDGLAKLCVQPVKPQSDPDDPLDKPTTQIHRGEKVVPDQEAARPRSKAEANRRPPTASNAAPSPKKSERQRLPLPLLALMGVLILFAVFVGAQLIPTIFPQAIQPTIATFGGTEVHDPVFEEAMLRASRSHTTNSAWDVFTKEFAGIRMSLVPVGCFDMGSEDETDDERPIHTQCIETPYWIDFAEVSRGDYQACVEAEFCTSPPESNVSDTVYQPINQVTWFQAKNFCERRGKRLPTEVEWEYAARGPDSLVYPWGNKFISARVVNKALNNGNLGITQSMFFGASWVGSVHMSGNVWEWVSSKYQDYPYVADDGREEVNTTGFRVIRGGSLDSNGDSLRATNRFYNAPLALGTLVGFRCAGDID